MSVERRCPPVYEAIVDDTCQQDAIRMRSTGGRPFVRRYVHGELWPLFTSDGAGEGPPPHVVLVREVQPGFRLRAALRAITASGVVPTYIDWSRIRGLDSYDQLYLETCRRAGVKPGPLRPDDNRIWDVRSRVEVVISDAAAVSKHARGCRVDGGV